MANATLRYHSHAGYGFYVKLTPISIAKPLQSTMQSETTIRYQVRK
jgi:hypothetical protein